MFTAVVFYFVSLFYRKTSVELQRLEALSRSPLLSHFSESLTGRSSIRAYRQMGRFARLNYALANANTRAFLTLQIARQWLALRLDTIGALLLFLVAIMLVNGAATGNTACTSLWSLCGSLCVGSVFCSVCG